MNERFFLKRCVNIEFFDFKLNALLYSFDLTFELLVITVFDSKDLKMKCELNLKS
jgi:hypothetical protein